MRLRLAELADDLPDDEAPAPAGIRQALAPAPLMTSWIGAFFNNVERGGRLAVPPRLMIRSVFGNIELDLRGAEFGPGLTEISVEAVFGNVEVKLPGHVAVENRGDTVMGSFVVCLESGGSWSFSRADATVRITGRSVLSTVEFASGAREGR